MRYAVIRGDDIENLIEWDGKEAWSPPDGATAAKADYADVVVDMEWKWNAGRPIDPTAIAEPVETPGVLAAAIRLLLG